MKELTIITKEELKKRTKLFAIRIFKFINTLPKSQSTDVVTHQILKSSSSVTANYRAVCRGKSSADFFNKLKIVDEEADETLFWLEFINDLELKCDKKELELLMKEADELTAIFSAAIKTIKSKNNY
ncbi:MAG: four helix bundle protein [Bacteroidia bacterium]